MVSDPHSTNTSLLSPYPSPHIPCCASPGISKAKTLFYCCETAALESKAVLFSFKRGGPTHVGQRRVSGESARLGHCLGLHVIPTVTVVTVLTPFSLGLTVLESRRGDLGIWMTHGSAVRSLLGRIHSPEDRVLVPRQARITVFFGSKVSVCT